MADETYDPRDLLSKPMAEFPDLPQLPGNVTFYGKLIGLSAGHSRGKGTPLFNVQVRLTDAGKDVPSSWLDDIKSSGFSLADFNVYYDFYLTPNAMKMLRRFLGTLGFSDNSSFVETLHLDKDGNPTADTQEALRGLDVICKTQAQDDQGRVFQNLASIAGYKPPA